MEYLLEKNEVVQIAPAGHLFKHPSGTRSKVFIQAREMARSEPELFFVSNVIALQNGKILKDAEVVYIDSMGIYHYVREALESAKSNARIESFHSYDEVNRISPPIESYVCIISASTTGGMANRLVRNQGLDQNRVVTLIDITSNDRSGSILISLDKLGGTYCKQLTNGTETEIELVGEHFSSKAKPPRSVTLGIPHKPKFLKEFLNHFALSGFHGFNFKPYGGAAKSKLLYFDSSQLSENTDFIKWLSDEIDWCITLAVDHIIHTPDSASKKLANVVMEKIHVHKQSSESFSVISSDNICRENLKIAKGILVVTAIAGDGSLLREISRSLREYVHTQKPRHFLVAVGLPQTEESWLHLRQFLERNPTDRKYGFSNWLVLPVGYDGDDNAWKKLNELAQAAQVVDTPMIIEGIEKDIIDRSLEQLAQVIKDSHPDFLPKTDGGKLTLSEGFLYFEGEFDNDIKRGNINSNVVYLAIASALQCARELKDKKNQLKATGYESVVLSPECFLRFNDNILQACILRACYPSELDYSANPHLSKLMKEFLTKVFVHHDQMYGDAALEFAAALVSGRLKLKTDDFDTVTKIAIDKLKSEASPLLGFFILAELAKNK